MSEKKRVIIYSKKAYALSEEQFEELSAAFITAESLPADIPLATPCAYTGACAFCNQPILIFGSCR